MKSGFNSQEIAASAVARINSEYVELLNLTTPISLLQLFNSPSFDFEDYCKDFSPHPAIRELKEITLQFGGQYGILLPSAQHYITCAMFLFPAAPIDKIIQLSKLYAVDFYLNDTMGREAKPTMEEQAYLYEIRDRLTAIGDNLETVEDISLAEKANLEVLAEIAKVSPKSWFKSFLTLYLSHINVAHKTYDAGIQAIEEYVDVRCNISGMPHTVSLVEYINDVYLNWELLNQTRVGGELQRLNLTVSLVGALANDLFSFEKEVIDHKTDSNLIVVIALNNFRMKLMEAITVAGSVIRYLLKDYVHTLQNIERQLDDSSILSNEDKFGVYRYLAGIKPVLQACWTWQKNTKRYKRENSIWMETSIQEPVAL